jgi:2,3-bisphosphoglycerate-dependent phosphoglycerate mutase
MKLIIIRHGESIADIMNVIEGRADFELTKRGLFQASLMSEYVKKNYNVNRIYSSTLKRAKQTSEQLSSLITIPITYSKDLMEFDNGKLAGLSREVATILYPKKEGLQYDESMYEMESLKSFNIRAQKVLNEIIENTGIDETIVIVSHGGLINQMYHSFLHNDLANQTHYPTGDTGVHLWEIKNKQRTVVLSNYLGHISNESRTI